MPPKGKARQAKLRDCPEWWLCIALFVFLVVVVALGLYNHYTLRDQMNERMTRIELQVAKVEDLRLQILDDLQTIKGKLNGINSRLETPFITK